MLAALLHFYPALTWDQIWSLSLVQLRILMSKMPLLRGVKPE